MAWIAFLDLIVLKDAMVLAFFNVLIYMSERKMIYLCLAHMSENGL